MKRIIAHVVIPIVILAAAGFGVSRIVSMNKEPERKEATETAPPVELLTIDLEEMTMQVAATGSVVPARQVTLTPEVQGRVMKLSDKLIPGAFFKKGEIIARIDQRDYQLAIVQERGRVHQSELELELEKGRAEIAERELEVLGREKESKASVPTRAWRIPQLGVAKQNTESAKSGLSRAQLNLNRTVVKAPFNSVVVDKRVDVGQVVGPSTPITTLMGTDEVWINLSVPVAKLPFIKIPGVGGELGSEIEVYHRIGKERQVVREGHVIRLQGKLDDRNRTATVVAEIDSPFDSESSEIPLLAGAYVESKIKCDGLVLGVALPRAALVEGTYVWVVDKNDRIEKRVVEIGWRLRDRVVVIGGLKEGERVVTSPLAKPLTGMKVKPIVKKQDESQAG